MGIFNNNKKNIIKIAQDDLNDAKLSSMNFETENKRKKAFVDVLGARLAMKLLFSKKIEANNLYSLYTIHNVLEQLDLSDIYFQNIKIDVRLVFNQNEIFIPKSHFDYNILPDLYLVLCLREDFSSAELLGFFEPSALDKSYQNDENYFVEQDKLQNPDSLKKFLNNFSSSIDYSTTEEELQQAECLFLSSIDKEISNEDKLFLLQQLAKSIDLREKCVQFENFEHLAKKTVQEEILFNDSVLDIVGAQRVFEEDLLENLEEVQIAETEEIEIAETIEEPQTVEEPEEIKEIEEMEEAEESEESNEIEYLKDPEDLEFLAEELPIFEEEDAEKSKSSDGLISAVAEGTIIAGGVALAGGAIAAGASAMAQASMVESSAKIIDGISDIGGAVIDNLPDVSLEDFFSSEKSDSDIEDSFNNLQDDLGDSEEAEVEFIENIEEVDEFESDVDNLPEFDFEEPSFEEESEGIVLEYLDDAEEAEEYEPEIEFEIEKEAEFEEPVFEEEAIIGLDLDEVQPLDTEESSFEDLLSLGDFQNLVEPILEEESIQIDEEESKEEMVNLDSFDFGMFDDNAEEELIPVEELVETQEENVDKELVSFETVEELEDIENIEAEEETEEPALEEEIESEPQISDLAGEEISLTQDLNDIESITSQVDELLNDVSEEESSLVPLIEEVQVENTEAEEFAPVAFENQSVFDEIGQEYPKQEIESELFATDENLDTDDKDLLKLLFKKEDITEKVSVDGEFTGEAPQGIDNKKKKVIIAASVAGVMIVSLAVGGIAVYNNSKNADATSSLSQPPAVTEMQTQGPTDTSLTEGANPMSQGIDQAPVSQSQPIGQAQPNRDMGQAVSDAFISEPVNASISKLAWEVPEDLAYNDSFRKYLQVVGKNLKLTLQNDLLLSTEMAYSTKVVVDLTLDKSVGLKNSNVVVSSGSKQIDDIVLQSVKETLKYLKMPASELSSQSVNVTLIINF